MADTPATKRYDVGGRSAGGRRTYPEGSVLKLTDAQAEAMGLDSSNVSTMSTTADDAAKVNSYEDALTRQDAMRAAELGAANPQEPTTEATSKKRAAPKS